MWPQLGPVWFLMASPSRWESPAKEGNAKKKQEETKENAVEESLRLKVGYLKKKSPKAVLGRHVWQARYFMLTHTDLVYWKREEDMRKKPNGYLGKWHTTFLFPKMNWVSLLRYCTSGQHARS